MLDISNHAESRQVTMDSTVFAQLLATVVAADPAGRLVWLTTLLATGVLQTPWKQSAVESELSALRLKVLSTVPVCNGNGVGGSAEAGTEAGAGAGGSDQSAVSTMSRLIEVIRRAVVVDSATAEAVGVATYLSRFDTTTRPSDHCAMCNSIAGVGTATSNGNASAVTAADSAATCVPFTQAEWQCFMRMLATALAFTPLSLTFFPGSRNMVQTAIAAIVESKTAVG